MIEPRLDPDLYNNYNNNKSNRIISPSRSESVDSINSNKTSSSTNQSKIQNLTHSRNNSNSGLTSDKVINLFVFIVNIIFSTFILHVFYMKMFTQSISFFRSSNLKLIGILKKERENQLNSKYFRLF